MVLGIMSLVLLFIGLSIPVAAMGIILALLSRDAEKMSGRAVVGLATSLVALAIGLISTIFSFYIIFSHGSFEQYLKEIYSQYQGAELLDDYSFPGIEISGIEEADKQ